MELRLDEKELKLKELLEISLQFFRANFKNLLPAISFYAIYLIAHAIWYFHRDTSYPLHLRTKHSFSKFIYGNSYFYVEVIVSSILSALCNLPIILIVDKGIQGIKISLREAIKLGYRIYLPFIWVSIMYSIIFITGIFLLFIPGIAWMTYYVFAEYAAALKGYKGMSALQYSKALVKGRWWRIFWILFISIFIAWIPFSYFTVLYKFVPKNLSLEVIRACLSSPFYCFVTITSIILFRNLEYFLAPAKAPEPGGSVPTW